MSTSHPSHRSDAGYSGSSQNTFCERLADDWQSLAAQLELKSHQTRAFEHGHEARALWAWLEQRGELSRLPQALRDIGREDLAGELVQRERQAVTQNYQQCIERWSGERFQLDQRFVHLNLLIDQGEDADGPRWQVKDSDLQSVAEVLAQLPDPAVVLLGDPGCGKSTLLRHHELDNANTQQRLPAAAQQQAPLTFFLPLNSYKPIHPGDPLPDPETWLAAEWARQNPDLPPLAELQASARLTLLLDALNEVPAAQQEVVSRWKDYLSALQQRAPRARLVFSCRSLDYSASLSSPDLPVPQVRVKPLSDEQIHEFLECHAGAQAGRLWAQLKGTRQLDLFRSAYYLKLLVDLAADGKLPEGHAELFTRVLRGLLKREVRARSALFMDDELLPGRDRMQLSQGQWANDWALPKRGPLVTSLAALACRMQAQREGREGGQLRVAYEQALQLLEHPRAADLLKAGEALGVVEEDLARDQVLFVHQLMQEWFAARHLAGLQRRDEAQTQTPIQTGDLQRLAVAWRADEVQPGLESTLAALADSDPLPPLPTTGWEETTQLAAAMAASPATFIDAVATVNLPLAGRCAAQPDVKVDDEQQRLRQQLLTRSQHPDADLRARIDAARALGELGDPRLTPGTGPDGDAYLLPPLVTIDGGEYTLGSEDGHYDRETPVHKVTLAGFRIAALPVTNAEWRLFMQAGGYDDERWWQGDQDRAWRRGEGTADGPKQQSRDTRRKLQGQPGLLGDLLEQGRVTSQFVEEWQGYADMSDEAFEALLDRSFPSGRQTEPRYWDNASYKHRSQPVVGVCWYEARAYCAWLRHQCGQAVRLPTEAEWEAAARGVGARRYPYGDDFDPSRGNTFETHVRKTTPVGVFPGGVTPEGVFDMSGNSWDWTSTLYQPYPYDSEDGREAQDSGDAGRRVVRGGSWNGDQLGARAASRGNFLPGNRSLGFGFRLLFPAPIFSDH